MGRFIAKHRRSPVIRCLVASFLICCFSLTCWATTTYTSIVDPDNGGGTDYTSLKAWADDDGGATSSDLPGNDERVVAQCRNSSGSEDDENSVDINFDTASGNDFLVEPVDGYGQTGEWDATNYVLKNPGVNSSFIRWYTQFGQFDNIQILCYSPGYEHGAFELRFVDAPTDMYITNCLIKGDFAHSTSDGKAIMPVDSDINLYVYNCIIYDFNSAQADSRAIDAWGFNTMYVWNCTIHNNYYGIMCRDYDAGPSAIIVINTVVFENTDDFAIDKGDMVITYSASDDGDCEDATCVSPSGGDWDNEFANYGSDDFSLASGGNLEDGGTDDPGNGEYDDDIIGTARESTWDIGAYEIAGAAPATAPAQAIRIMIH